MKLVPWLVNSWQNFKLSHEKILFACESLGVRHFHFVLRFCLLAFVFCLVHVKSFIVQSSFSSILDPPLSGNMCVSKCWSSPPKKRNTLDPRRSQFRLFAVQYLKPSFAVRGTSPRLFPDATFRLFSHRSNCHRYWAFLSSMARNLKELRSMRSLMTW